MEKVTSPHETLNHISAPDLSGIIDKIEIGKAVRQSAVQLTRMKDLHFEGNKDIGRFVQGLMSEIYKEDGEADYKTTIK